MDDTELLFSSDPIARSSPDTSFMQKFCKEHRDFTCTHHWAQRLIKLQGQEVDITDPQSLASLCSQFYTLLGSGEGHRWTWPDLILHPAQSGVGDIGQPRLMSCSKLLRHPLRCGMWRWVTLRQFVGPKAVSEGQYPDWFRKKKKSIWYWGQKSCDITLFWA